jgi:hypothetical protein
MYKGEIQREHSKDPWLGQTTNDILQLQYQASQYQASH